MTALSQDTDPARRIAELEQRLQSSAAENGRLQRELALSRERQTAGADILATIAGVSGDADQALQQIAETTARLFGASSVSIQLAENGEWGKSYRYGASAQRIRAAVPLADIKVGGRNLPGAVVGRNQQIHAPDLDHLEGDLAEFPGLPHARAAGTRTICGTPLRSKGKAIGALIIHRDRLEPFSAEELALQQSFADQAAIAIENARLFNETREALERQTATAGILRVIASSPSDVQPVFEAIATSSKRLIGGFSTAVFRFVDDVAHLVAFTPTTPAADEVLKAGFPSPVDRFEPFKLAQGGKPVQIADIEALPDSQIKQIARARGFRGMLFSPLMSNGAPIGLISVTRTETGSFFDHHVQLLQTFADQAVIAIENVRLFEQVQARTRDLTEALQQQTATADVLKVISRSAFDLQTVLDALLSSACRLCEADIGTIRYEDGGSYRLATTYGCKPEWIEHFQTYTTKADRSSIFGRTILERRPIHVPDVLADPDYSRPQAQKLMGFRAALGVPLVREGHAFGVINLFRFAAGSFEDKQIELVTTFADQAVIAIENVRLFEQVQARTRDLAEALQQQTATSEVLEIISASTGELGPVFQKMLENATRICGAAFGTLTLYEDGGFRTVAVHNVPKAFAAIQLHQLIRPHPQSGLRLIERTHQTVHIDDIRSQPPYIEGHPNVRALADLAGARTLLMVPLLKENDLVGTITIFRQEVKPFTAKQTELVANFAKQAVIAIENARLLNELRQRTTELSQSLDELRTAQDRLVQTEKLASLGQLTAGIAHEIKNPLNFVNNFSALSAELIDELGELLGPAALDDKTRADIDELAQMLKGNLDKVVQHGKRADSIVRNMLLHSRQGSGERRPADVNAIVEESLNLAYHGARAEKSGFNVTLKRDLDPEAGTAELYPQEITRVFLNLISNGFYAAHRRKEAAGDGFEPTLSATTKARGSEVEIRIRDNGTGIPEDVRAKIFNPFFTTKPAGEGTGLGLSMSHDIIVKQHGGRIDVETEPGAFTEFIITLPRTWTAQGNTGGSN